MAAPSRIATISHSAVRIVGKRASLEGRRIAVLHPEPGAADAIAQTLRQRGAQVAVLHLDPSQLARAEVLDPEVVVVDPAHFTGACWPTLSALFAHPQLRWTCVLVAATEQADGIETHDLPGLCAQVQLLSADYDAAVARARTAQEFDVPLETLGPARVLRVLVQSGKSFRALFNTSAITMEVDVAEGILVGARGGRGRTIDDSLLGVPGLNALLRESHGFVRARSVARPAVTNVMSPLDTALAGAMHGRELAERSEVKESRPSAKASLPALSPAIAGGRGLTSRTLIGIPAAVQSAGRPSTPPSEATRTIADLVLPANDNDVTDATQRDALHRLSSSSLALAATLAPTQRAAASLPSARVSQIPQAASQAPSARPSRAPGPTSRAPERNAQRESATSLPPAEAAQARPRSLEPAASPSGTPAAERIERLYKPLVASVVAASVALGLSALWPERSSPSNSLAAAPAPAAVASTGSVGLVPPGVPIVEGLPPSWRPPSAGGENAAVEPRSVDPVIEPASDEAVRTTALAALAPAVLDPATSNGQGAENVEANSALAGVGAPEQAPQAESATTAPAALSQVRGALESSRPARVSRAQSRRASVLAKQANAQLRAGRTARAKSLYESGLRTDPRNPRVLSGLAQLGLKQRDAALALTHAQALVGERPRSASAQLLLGDAQRMAGDVADAERSFKRAAQLGSTEARSRLRALARSAE